MESNVSQEDILDRLVQAVCELFRHDAELLHRDANERSISHKLAEHIRVLFPDWHVDCEYNRKGIDPKRLVPNYEPFDIQPWDTTARTVFPDIIVHRRGIKENLVVIELKKSDTCDKEITNDLEKLRAFTSGGDFSYRFGLFLQVGCEGCISAKLFKGGVVESDCKDRFTQALQELGYGG